MTGKTSSSLQAVIVIHICSFPKQHTYFSFYIYYPQTRDHFFVNKRCKQDTEKIILEVTLHRSEGATHNDAWDAQWCSVYRQQYHQCTPSQWYLLWILVYTGNNTISALRLSGTRDESCRSDDPVKIGVKWMKCCFQLALQQLQAYYDESPAKCKDLLFTTLQGIFQFV